MGPYRLLMFWKHQANRWAKLCWWIYCLLRASVHASCLFNVLLPALDHTSQPAVEYTVTWKLWNISSIILLISSTVYSVCSLGGGDNGSDTTPSPIIGQPYNNNYYVPQQPAGTVSYYHRHIIINNNKVIICLWLLLCHPNEVYGHPKPFF